MLFIAGKKYKKKRAQRQKWDFVSKMKKARGKDLYTSLAGGREFAKFLRSLEQFIQIVH